MAGCALLVAAHGAGASSSEQILRVGAAGSSAQIDPQLAYDPTSWWLVDLRSRRYEQAVGKLEPRLGGAEVAFRA